MHNDSDKTLKILISLNQKRVYQNVNPTPRNVRIIKRLKKAGLVKINKYGLVKLDN